MHIMGQTRIHCWQNTNDKKRKGKLRCGCSKSWAVGGTVHVCDRFLLKDTSAIVLAGVPQFDFGNAEATDETATE